MIVLVVKQSLNGRYADVDANQLYTLGSIITFANGKSYIVKSINGSKINLEEITNEV